MKIGIVGGGFVGAATALFECKDIEVLLYDIDRSKCKPSNCTLLDLCGTDLIFICVPTPMRSGGECHTSIVEKVVSDLFAAGRPVPPIILRSTVPPKTCGKLKVHHMPEFLTEKNFENDFRTNKLWIVGLHDHSDNNSTVQTTIKLLLELAKEAGVIEHSDCVFVTTEESSMIKYARNTFLAVKVGFCNEVKEICDSFGANYDVVRRAFAHDQRIGYSHTQVPGHDGMRGFGGTCLPKDINACIAMAKKSNIDTPILSAVCNRNEQKDRKSQDWKKDVGRAFVQ